jgi:chromosome segregation ATPase
MATTKKIIDVAKELLEEKIVSFIEPSERKVESARKKVEDAKNNLKKAEEQARNEQEQWFKLKKELESKINANKTSINNFKKKLNKASDKVKVKYEQKLDELEEKNHKMMVKMGKYKDDKVEKWEAFKNIFMRDMEEIGSSLSDLSKSILK